MRIFLMMMCLVSTTLFAEAGVSHGQEAAAKIEQIQSGTFLLDVRKKEEFMAGTIYGSILMPHDQLEKNIAAIIPDKKSPVIIYCRSGRRSKIAADAMKRLGYENVRDFGGMPEAAKKLRRTPSVPTPEKMFADIARRAKQYTVLPQNIAAEWKQFDELFPGYRKK